MERGVGEEFRGDTGREVEQFSGGFDEDLVRGVVALGGEAQDGGGEGGDDAVGFGVGIIKTRDGAGVGGVTELRVVAHGRAEAGCGQPALEFEEGAGDGAAPEFVAAARIAETPAGAARVVDRAVGCAGGDERAGAGVDHETGCAVGREFEDRQRVERGGDVAEIFE